MREKGKSFVFTVFTGEEYLVLAVTSVIQVKQVDRQSSTSTHFKMDPSEQISLHRKNELIKQAKGKTTLDNLKLH